MPAGPLRIVQVLRAPIGGLFRHVSDLSTELAGRGHLLGIVVDSLTADAQTESKLAKLKPLLALGLHALPMPRLLGSGDLSTPLALRRLARRLDADILHGHGAKGGLYARLAKSARSAALYTPHGGVLHFPPTSASGRVFGFLERRLMRRTDAMIFESEFARAAFARQIATPTCPTSVIHNGLAPAEFVPVTPGPNAADFAFVGELRELKGIFVLVDALAQLGSEGDGPTLVMAGDGPDREVLETRIAALGLTGRVKLLGVQPARSVFAQGRCVVVPSLAESLPYVVLEAAAAGRPVIATRVGGIAEIFGPTAEALVEAGDAASLARAMAAVLADPAAAASEADTRLGHVQQGFSIATMTDAIERLYYKAIDRG